MKRAGRAKCSLSLHGWSTSEHRGEKWQLNCKRTEHSLTLDILFGQDLCLWHHLTSWMDQDSLVEVIPFHPHPRSHHLSCHCLCQSFLGKNWRNRERRTSFPESKKISLFLLSLGRLPSFFFSALARCWKEQKIRIKGGLLSRTIYRYYIKGAKCPLYWDDFDF